MLSIHSTLDSLDEKRMSINDVNNRERENVHTLDRYERRRRIFNFHRGVCFWQILQDFIFRCGSTLWRGGEKFNLAVSCFQIFSVMVFQSQWVEQRGKCEETSVEIKKEIFLGYFIVRTITNEKLGKLMKFINRRMAEGWL